MEKWIGKVALVTGAGSGIGRAIARDLAKEGMNVVGVDIKEDRLKAMEEELTGAQGSFLGMKCDLTMDEEILAVFKFIKTKFGGVDVCVNNAGMSFSNDLLNGNPFEWRTMMNTNVVALCLCSKETYVSLTERNQDLGHIINICSMCGHQVVGIPNLNFYVSTKFAVRAITEGLRQELRESKSHIRISSISPGRVSTEFSSAIQFSKEVQQLLESYKPLEPEDISQLVLQVLATPLHVEVNDIMVTPTDENL